MYCRRRAQAHAPVMRYSHTYLIFFSPNIFLLSYGIKYQTPLIPYSVQTSYQLRPGINVLRNSLRGSASLFSIIYLSRTTLTKCYSFFLLRALNRFPFCQSSRDLRPMTIMKTTTTKMHPLLGDFRRSSRAKFLAETKRERYYGVNRQQNLQTATIRFESWNEDDRLELTKALSLSVRDLN